MDVGVHCRERAAPIAVPFNPRRGGLPTSNRATDATASLFDATDLNTRRIQVALREMPRSADAEQHWALAREGITEQGVGFESAEHLGRGHWIRVVLLYVLNPPCPQDSRPLGFRCSAFV